LPSNDELTLARVLTRRVLTIAIDASGIGFNSYAGGIYDGMYAGSPDCSIDINLADHTTVLVGFIPEYFIMRNSWGPAWGINGYMFIARKYKYVFFFKL